MTEELHQPEKIRIGRIETVDQIEVELRRVYRHARKGTISSDDGWRFAKILQMMVGIKREVTLEDRIKRLEELLNEPGNTSK